jgi:hypothetical protein
MLVPRGCCTGTTGLLHWNKDGFGFQLSVLGFQNSNFTFVLLASLVR